MYKRLFACYFAWNLANKAIIYLEHKVFVDKPASDEDCINSFGICSADEAVLAACGVADPPSYRSKRKRV